MTFATLGLLDPLLRAIDALAFQTPTPIQARAIPPILQGRDVLAAAQTGTGKTAAFGIPLLQRLMTEGSVAGANQARALILVPTRELAEQVHGDIQALASNLPFRGLVAYGGVSINPQMMKLRRGVDLMVATPGRLLDLHRQNAVRFDCLQVLVLDEADRMLDLGFANDLDAIFRVLPKRRQTLLFSATFSDVIRQMATAVLDDAVSIEVSPRNTAAQTVKQWLVTVDKKRKAELLLHLWQTRRWRQALVFVKTRKSADQVVESLTAAGIPADSIHGDKPQPARLRALQRFENGEVAALVATDVAARGLDIPSLPLVVNLDLPIVPEDYVHRIGRTGRAGSQGEAVSLVCADEVGQLAAIETLIRQVLPRHDEPDFIPDHRVPQTTVSGQVLKKPKKPKQKTIPGATGRIHLGALEDTAKPAVKAVRAMPGFNKKPTQKPFKKPR